MGADIGELSTCIRGIGSEMIVGFCLKLQEMLDRRRKREPGNGSNGFYFRVGSTSTRLGTLVVWRERSCLGDIAGMLCSGHDCWGVWLWKLAEKGLNDRILQDMGRLKGRVSRVTMGMGIGLRIVECYYQFAGIG